MELLQKIVQEVTDPDFVWEEYLETTKSEGAPSEAFTHVEYSLKSGFKEGMKLEIPNPDDNGTYWIGSVIVICGELLTLRYAGYGDDDRSGDFWLDTKSAEFHPLGWCSLNSKRLFPPKVVLDRNPNVHALLEEELRKVQNMPALLLEDFHASFMPIDQIKCSMKVEVSEDFDPESVWIATILQNVGGRLMLRYDGISDSSEDFWLFYLSDRLYQVGYAPENNLKYCAPKALKGKHSDKEWNDILKKSIEDSMKLLFPAHVLEPKLSLEEHGFSEGMKLEIVDLQSYTRICPATVSSVVDSFYFLVTIDSFAMDDSMEKIMCCNSNSQLIFPVNWAEENELDLTVPKGYEVVGSKFVWKEYLDFCNAIAAPSELFTMCCMNTGFKDNHKLEAVDPLNPSHIFVATIDKIVEPIMYLHFDVDESRQIITGVNSFDVFPMGWCASNSYPLQTPSYRSKSKATILSNVEPESPKSIVAEIKVPVQTEQQGKSWCPKIYFNHRCFTGPLLSKSRLAELPKAIGPGPVHLVMNEVISRVVNIAYKSSRVLQILQIHGKPSSGMQQQVVKAKYKGKSYRATLEVIRHSDQVEEFCKRICTKLECCTYLFGPKHVEEICPSKCHTQTKTKFGYNFVKKHKKPGRPPLPSVVTSDPIGETIRKGPGRKKKRKHWTQLLAASENSQKENIKNEDSPVRDESDCKDDITTENSPSPSSNLDSQKKFKHLPSSSIVTRGAKLPNFGLWHHVTSFHSRPRGRPRTRLIRPIKTYPPRKVGRPLGSTKKAIAMQKDIKKEEDDDTSNAGIEEESCSTTIVSSLTSNPIDWSVDEVVKYIQETDCAPIAPLLKEQEIDGQALLMLNIVNVQQYLNLKPEPAEKFCYIIKSLKIQFFTHFV